MYGFHIVILTFIGDISSARLTANQLIIQLISCESARWSQGITSKERYMDNLGGWEKRCIVCNGRGTRHKMSFTSHLAHSTMAFIWSFIGDQLFLTHSLTSSLSYHLECLPPSTIAASWTDNLQADSLWQMVESTVLGGYEIKLTHYSD